MLSQPLIKCNTYVLLWNKLTVHIKLFKYIKSTAYKNKKRGPNMGRHLFEAQL